jgi:hypothetical protein
VSAHISNISPAVFTEKKIFWVEVSEGEKQHTFYVQCILSASLMDCNIIEQK